MMPCSGEHEQIYHARGRKLFVLMHSSEAISAKYRTFT